jgi:poly-gamma-glutamate capsule biosynthesis protein CapA/YwtB (metallophosphatase superfamily)
MRFKTWLIAILLFSSQNIYAQLQYVNNDTSNFLKILIVGDVSLNQQILDASFMKSANKYDFQHIFHYIRPVLNLGDIVVGNIDNSFGQTKNYLKDGLKNAPNEYGVALKYAGFNLLMNANKSAVYQDLAHWRSNKKFLDDIHITQIGSFEHEQDRYKRNPTVIEKYGIKVAFLNYMEALPFYPELSPLVNGLREDIVKRDLLLAKNRGADFTIVYMNWGSEFETTENDAQKKLADLCLENGANLVVGCHPNVVQNANVEEDIVNGKITSNIVFYSLGNFISTNSNPMLNSAAIVEIILEKDKRNNVTFVNDVSYIPTFTAMYDNEGLAQYAIMPVSQVEKNNITVPLNQTEIKWMKGSTEQIRQKLNGKS